MSSTRSLRTIALAALTAISLVALNASASARPATWRTVPLAKLSVTSGAVAPYSPSLLSTRSGEMRAVELDNGRHATWGRLVFRLLGASDDTKPLGSGLIRQQIGLKLHAQDPCNLVYVMWRTAPDSAIAVFVKRNAGQTTSSQCGNNGYTDMATIPVPAVAAGTRHVLEVRTRRAADGSLVLSVYTDGALLRSQALPADLVAGLDGSIGVRSDNGAYAFRLLGAKRVVAAVA
ncbi:MAG: hypothetical protein QOG68_222 [Solirubrobacteraceae bacterium]|nr:hypothetical protein [Solirubrobacteraceae bacterium]